MIYLISNIPFVLSLILLCLIGQTALLEKKRVLSVLFLLCALLGIWLGSYGKELDATEYVIPMALIVLGIFLMFKIEFTLVGFALMAIVTGFFNGHDMGINLPYSNPMGPFMGYVIAYGTVAIFLTERLKKIIPESYGFRVIGGLVALFGVIFGQYLGVFC